MDWSQARGILLVAFAMVNLVLAYSIWGPTGIFPELSGTPHQQQVLQIRNTLAERGFELVAAVPKAPERLPFLRVEHNPTLNFDHLRIELSEKNRSPSHDSERMAFEAARGWAEPRIDPETLATIYQIDGKGFVNRDWRLENREQVQDEVHRFLTTQQILPKESHLHVSYPKPQSGNYIVEYFPLFQEFPVFSGFVRVEVSSRGIEQVVKFWVRPLDYKDNQQKPIRPAAEALLRLVGHLERTGNKRRVITDIRLGYYAGRGLTPLQSGEVNRWDTVPVWRVQLDTGVVYYINAFTGEFES